MLVNMSVRDTTSRPHFLPDLKSSCVLNHFSHVRLSAPQGTVAHQVPLSMGFSRQEYWSELPCPPPENLYNPGIEPTSLMSPALADRFFTTSAPGEAQN